MWEREKLLITSEFPIAQSVFKRLGLQTWKNQGLFGKELTLSQKSPGFYVSTSQIFWKHCAKRKNR